MGKINRYLKCLFIFFNVLFAILGCVLIYGAMKSSTYSLGLSAVGRLSLARRWSSPISVLGISCLGIYAGFSEKEIVLKIFAGFMVVGMIIMLVFGIIMVDTGNKDESSFEVKVAEAAKSLKENKELRKKLDGLQQSDHCCGVVNASDWGGNIPSSCNCSGYGGYGGSECKPKPQGVCGPDRIYAQPCSKVMFVWIDLVFKAALGLCFGFAVIALLDLLVSLLMIRQIQYHDSWGRTSIAMKGCWGDP